MKKTKSSILVLALAPLLACTTVIQLGAEPTRALDDGGVDAAVADDARDAEATTDAAPCAELALGTTTRTITHAGNARTYQAFRPAAVAPCGKRQALFGFHGLGGSAAGDGSRHDATLEALTRSGAVGVFIDGTVNGDGLRGFGCAGCLAWEAADDVGLVRAIIAELGLDPSRSVAIGADVGGSFVHRLVAELPLPAGAVLGGVLGTATGSNGSSIVRPVAAKAPAMMFLQHGENDPIYPFGGGRGERGDLVTSVGDATMFWRKANGCAAEASTSKVTALTYVQTFACNGVAISVARWNGARHILPDDDPENPAVGLTAVLGVLLAR